MPDKWEQYAEAPQQGGDKWAQYQAPPSPPQASQHVQGHQLKGENFGDWLSEELLGPVVNAATTLGRGLQGLGHPEQRPLTQSAQDVISGGLGITAPFAMGGLGGREAAPPPATPPVPGVISTALKGGAVGGLKAVPNAIETSILRYTGLPQVGRGIVTGAKEALEARQAALNPAPATDPLLDKIAQGYGVKDFSSLRPEDQAIVQSIAARMGGGAQVAPAQPASAPAYTPRPPEYYGVKAAEAPPQPAPSAPAPNPASAAPPSVPISPQVSPSLPPKVQPIRPEASPEASTPASSTSSSTSTPKSATPAAQAKSARYADAISKWAKDQGISPETIAEGWEVSSPETRGRLILRMRRAGYLGANETIPNTSAQGIIDALKARAATQ